MSAQVFVLSFVDAQEGEHDFPLRAGESYIAGRSTEADLVINEDTVSRKHARFFHARGGVWVRDLGSRNGTVVNGASVDRHRLAAGDRVSLGARLFRISQVSAESVRAPSPEESSGRSMSGNIRDIPLADVLQWLATSRKTGTLRVMGETNQGALSLQDGRVCYARIEGREGLDPEKALLRMLSWSEGGFGLDSTTEDVPDPIAPSLEAVLMEAARMQDELQHLADRYELPTARVVLANPSPGKWSELGEEDLQMLQQVHEVGDWEQILDAGEDDVAMTKRIGTLHKKGYVTYEG